MVWSPDTTWKPTRLMEVAGSVDTSTGVTEVTTDAGRAFIKTLGNRQGPHVLATDWVGTHLAKWLGLTTFDVAILNLDDDDRFPLPHGYTAEPGPAFATRALRGEPWGRSGLQLDVLVNPEDITRLVVFDTWTQNCDRQDHPNGGRSPNYDNVFLSSDGVEAGKRRLIAMDHGLCFIRSGEEITARIANIGKVKAPNVYGLFREFRDRLQQDIIVECTTRLRKMDSETAEAIVGSIPGEWEVKRDAGEALRELISRRAEFVADHIEAWIDEIVPWFRPPGE